MPSIISTFYVPQKAKFTSAEIYAKRIYFLLLSGVNYLVTTIDRVPRKFNIGQNYYIRCKEFACYDQFISLCLLSSIWPENNNRTMRCDGEPETNRNEIGCKRQETRRKSNHFGYATSNSMCRRRIHKAFLVCTGRNVYDSSIAARRHGFSCTRYHALEIHHCHPGSAAVYFHGHNYRRSFALFQRTAIAMNNSFLDTQLNSTTNSYDSLT